MVLNRDIKQNFDAFELETNCTIYTFPFEFICF